MLHLAEPIVFHSSPSSVGKPVRALVFRLLRTCAISALIRVPVYAFAAGVTLFLAAQFLEWALADKLADAVGQWTVTVLLSSVGVVLGSIAGLSAAVRAALQTAGSDLQSWIAEVSEGECDQQSPTIDVARLQSGNSDTIQRFHETAVGIIPLPRFVLRMMSARLPLVLWEELAVEAQSNGTATLSFADARSFVLTRILSFGTKHQQTQLNVVIASTLGLVLAIAGIAIVVGLLCFAPQEKREALSALCSPLSGETHQHYSLQADPSSGKCGLS